LITQKKIHTYTEWSSWTNCSLACGSGKKTRVRTVLLQPTAHGHPCDGGLDDSTDCQDAPCPIDCSWGDWSSWSDCTVTCNNGTKSRIRNSRGPEWGGKICPGDPIEKMNCSNPTTCQVDCEWTTWTAWGTCSAVCGSTQTQGTSNRSRYIYIQPQNGGYPCSGTGSDSRPCVGTDSDCSAPQPAPTPDSPSGPTVPNPSGFPDVDTSQPKGGLSTGAIIGIAIGSAIAVLVVAVAVASAIVCAAPPAVETV